jgi:hypothetical protein
LGRSSRDIGHRRVPEPPDRMTGTIVVISAMNQAHKDIERYFQEIFVNLADRGAECRKI